MVRVYDPGTAEHWKTCIAEAAKEIQWDKTELPVGIVATFIMPRPKAHFKKSGLRSDAPSWHIIKPDSDNLEKAVLDALTTLGAWRDDSQICNKHIKKIYGENPGMNISISY